jgi:hypothetical protein
VDNRRIQLLNGQEVKGCEQESLLETNASSSGAMNNRHRTQRPPERDGSGTTEDSTTLKAESRIQNDKVENRFDRFRVSVLPVAGFSVLLDSEF